MFYPHLFDRDLSKNMSYIFFKPTIPFLIEGTQR